jgi:hypothetical protein
MNLIERLRELAAIRLTLRLRVNSVCDELSFVSTFIWQDIILVVLFPLLTMVLNHFLISLLWCYPTGTGGGTASRRPTGGATGGMASRRPAGGAAGAGGRHGRRTVRVPGVADEAGWPRYSLLLSRDLLHGVSDKITRSGLLRC